MNCEGSCTWHAVPAAQTGAAHLRTMHCQLRYIAFVHIRHYSNLAWRARVSTLVHSCHRSSYTITKYVLYVSAKPAANPPPGNRAGRSILPLPVSTVQRDNYCGECQGPDCLESQAQIGLYTLLSFPPILYSILNFF